MESSALISQIVDSGLTMPLMRVFGWQGGTVHQVARELLKERFNLAQAKKLISELGGTACEGACWEDHRDIYASSVETVPGTYGHPRYEVQFSKETRWLSISGHKPIQII